MRESHAAVRCERHRVDYIKTFRLSRWRRSLRNEDADMRACTLKFRRRSELLETGKDSVAKLVRVMGSSNT